MRFFIQEKSNPQLKKVDKKLKVGTTNSYIEFELKQKDKYIVCYLVPHNENTMFAVTCLDHQFDFLSEQGENEDKGKSEAKAKAWPTLATLLQKNANDNDTQGTLLQLEDPDCGETKWFLATAIDNIDFKKQPDLGSEKVSQATKLVLETAMRLTLFYLICRSQENC